MTDAKLRCSECKVFIDEKDVETLEVEIKVDDEEFFICPHCKKKQRSIRYGQS